jgi:uncharacterized protein (DUF924 family)
VSPDDVLRFWFGGRCESADEIEALVEKCFKPNAALDADIRTRFGDLPDRAHDGDLDGWLATPRSTVALVIVLDQFPRNLYRGDARAFAYDTRAAEIARAWVLAADDCDVAPIEAVFGYLPFEHSENAEDQERSVALYSALALQVGDPLRAHFEDFTHFADRHRALIHRFGRFPHRNAVLGRPSTPEEARYLEEGGDTFGG